MKHAFTSAKVEGSDPTLVGPNEWNAMHIHSTRSTSANDTMTTADDVVFATAGAGGINETLPAPASCAGQKFKVFKADTAAGSVTVLPNGTEKIKSLNNLTATSYILVNAGQYVEVMSDGTNWWVTDAN